MKLIELIYQRFRGKWPNSEYNYIAQDGDGHTEGYVFKPSHFNKVMRCWFPQAGECLVHRPDFVISVCEWPVAEDYDQGYVSIEDFELYCITQRHKQMWDMIEGFYGDKVAKRSLVPLINHIIEGVMVLECLGATSNAIDAFIIHPLFQSDQEFFANQLQLRELPFEVMVNVMEYRRAANTFLCRPHTDVWEFDDVVEQVGQMSQDVRHMLIADKWQNQKDFRIHHLGTHDRSDQLERYFNMWLYLLCDSTVVERIDQEVGQRLKVQ